MVARAPVDRPRHVLIDTATDDILRALQWAVQPGASIAALRSSVKERPQRNDGDAILQSVRLGVGSPGTTGCRGIAHHTINWSIFTNADTGILTAMSKLDLSLVVLPGARLESGFSLPGRRDVHIYARGGPSYDSCTIIWVKNLAGRVHPQGDMGDMGTDRCIFSRIERGAAGDLWLIAVYFPSGHTQDADRRWHEEVKQLDHSMKQLSLRTISPSTHDFVLTGDINLQSSYLTTECS